MTYDFNSNEILKMAEQIERNGYQFYTAAAENVSDPRAKEFLLKLADMESQHEVYFASIYILRPLEVNCRIRRKR